MFVPIIVSTISIRSHSTECVSILSAARPFQDQSVNTFVGSLTRTLKLSRAVLFSEFIVTYDPGARQPTPSCPVEVFVNFKELLPYGPRPVTFRDVPPQEYAQISLTGKFTSGK